MNNNKIKIAIVGTHSTRKTTLCHLLIGKLKEKRKDVSYLAELATSCPLPINKDASVDAQLWILLSQIKGEVELEAKPFEYIVLDRCILDNYVYFERASDKIKQKDEEILSKMAIAKNLLNQWVGTYDFIFKVDVNSKDIEPDGFRDTDKDFRTDIENRLMHLCKSMNLKNVYYLSGSNEQKLNKMLEIIDNRQRKLNNWTKNNRQVS